MTCDYQKVIEHIEHGNWDTAHYFSSKGASAVHHVSSKAGEETIIYVRTNGKYDIISG